MRSYTKLFIILCAVGFGPVLYAQAVNPDATPTAVALGQQSMASGLLSFFMPRFLEWLKKLEKFPWIKDGAAKANRWFAVSVSVLQGSGLTWAYHSADAAHPDGWSFAFGSKHSSFEEWIVACLVSFAAQQYFYEQLPSVQADSMARALKKVLKES